MNSKQEESRQPSAAELKAMSPKQRGEYLASLAVQALRENTKDLPERKPRSPEVQARLKEFHSKIGQELVDNLNRNVMAESPQTDTQPSWGDQVTQRLEAAIKKFNQDNQGKTWEDLAQAQEAKDRAERDELLRAEAEKNLQGLS